MKLYIIGTGGPPPSPNRFGTSFILETQSAKLMVDCGPASTYKMTKLGLFPRDIEALIFTHHHFDHNADFPCFVLSRWDQQHGNENPLEVYGPPPTSKITGKLFGDQGAFRYDLDARINHPASQNVHRHRGGSLPRHNLELKTEDIQAGTEIEINGCRISCIEVRHVQPYLRSYAYRIDSEEGSVVFTGDAGASPEIPQLAAAADVLVIGCAVGEDRKNIPHLAEVSTGTEDIADYANKADVKSVVVTHMLDSAVVPGCREQLVREIAETFKGTIMIPDELQVIEIV